MSKDIQQELKNCHALLYDLGFKSIGDTWTFGELEMRFKIGSIHDSEEFITISYFYNGDHRSTNLAQFKLVHSFDRAKEYILGDTISALDKALERNIKTYLIFH